MACFQFSSFLYFHSFCSTPNFFKIIYLVFFWTFIPQTWFHIMCWSITGTVWFAVSFKFNETVDFYYMKLAVSVRYVKCWSHESESHGSDLLCCLSALVRLWNFSVWSVNLMLWTGVSWEWFALLSFRFSETVEFFFRSVNLMSWTGVSWEWFALLSFRFKETVEFFYVKPKPGENEVTPEYFFSLWHTFCQDFKDHWKREQQRIIKLRSAYSIVFSFSSGQHTA